MKRRSSRSTRGVRAQKDRGAVAVEFALVAPILLALVAGIVEFSHAYNLQISVTQAAREAAREMAIENDQTAAATAAAAGAPGLNAGAFAYTFSPGACSADENMMVTITYQAATLTGIFGNTLTVNGVGAMRCGG
ncbi:TadE/TadG family type IV pilus assembly protein [uncultured Arthrobacter sp.]|uniref:TadE/TadG family type IV pilus assembly protein n=1 Tax=uncultured Arthrobacter sp. TaxID=114050 RepID=UPI0028D0733D|nr:TadE/TadG family type IV pilus assembly protein [uncultured Arthrobacter sp.]